MDGASELWGVISLAPEKPLERWVGFWTFIVAFEITFFFFGWWLLVVRL